MLSGRNVEFGEYEQSALACPTHNAVYLWDATNPKVLQLRAQWRGVATNEDQYCQLVEQIALCNSVRTGPKAYLAPFEDGQNYGLIAECNIIATSGLTEKQLNVFFETSMSMIMGFFADLEVELPSFVTWPDENSSSFPENPQAGDHA
ncbi:histidine kinase [Schaalia sp. ZJ405]|uniref:histidine kinase n=1 Tax=unclassified Schaalia TaxID=2691889 RepID=UPI0013EB8A28|nr:MULTISPECIES: histidine kinase [unclassified Schaalia]QPK82343.1 histidine kinase [Schaalia sp. ZJ405]